MTATPGQRRYRRLNATWPEQMPSLQPQEAISAAKRLYRLGMGRAFKGTFKLTSGNRSTWIRSGIFYVNSGKGWKEMVHDISHYVHTRLHPHLAPHHVRHIEIERKLTDAVVTKWLDGALRRAPKAKDDIRVVRYKRVLARIVTWEAKRRRAGNALKKLSRQKAYYENVLGGED